METTLHEIHKLRKETNLLIQNLYKASIDQDTFESIVLPLPSTIPVDNSMETTKNPIKPKESNQIKKPIQQTRKEKNKLSPTKSYFPTSKQDQKNIHVEWLYQPNEFYHELQEYRNHYSDYYTKPIDTINTLTKSKHASSFNSRVENENQVEEMNGIRTGTFCITKQGSIQESITVPTLSLEPVPVPIGPLGIHVSIPKDTFYQSHLTAQSRFRGGYEEYKKDSVWIHHHIHPKYIPIKSKQKNTDSMSLLNECVVHLRNKKS
jgi:hypothetical protein